jgi:hypothetical protein
MFIIHTHNSSKKRKRKFKSAEEKARFLANQKSEYGVAAKRKVLGSTVNSLPSLGAPPGRETPKYRSAGDAVGSGLAKARNVYTGDKIKGIGTLHKSNAVPVFSDDEAKSLATMRR